MTIMKIAFWEDGSQGKANPLPVDVVVEVCATMNLKTILESSCPASKVLLGR